jgi:RNA polymerase sigma-70 factor (ECF subfamily)
VAEGTGKEDPDLTAIQEVLAGKTENFAGLVRKYQNRIYSLGLRFFRNREDACDFAQDVFIRTFERLAGFRGESRFSTWLMRVAYHHGISVYRSRKDSGSLPDDFDIPDAGENPELLHARNAAREALAKAIKLLPERYRLCIDLYFSFGMTYEEVSLVTDIPVGTVKSHVFRAKQALREALKNSDAEDYSHGM